MMDVVSHQHRGQGPAEAPPQRDRRVLTTSPMMRRTVLLHVARVIQYCHQEWHRCVVTINGDPWPLQDQEPRHILQGSLIEIELPPPLDERQDPCLALWESQHGPVRLWEELPDISQPSIDSASVTPWHLQILQSHLDHLSQWMPTHDDQLIECQPLTVKVWMVHHSHLRVCHLAREVRFAAGYASFLQALTTVWAGVFDASLPFHAAMVNLDLLGGVASCVEPPHMIIVQPHL